MENLFARTDKIQTFYVGQMPKPSGINFYEWEELNKLVLVALTYMSGHEHENYFSSKLVINGPITSEIIAHEINSYWIPKYWNKEVMPGCIDNQLRLILLCLQTLLEDRRNMEERDKNRLNRLLDILENDQKDQPHPGKCTRQAREGSTSRLSWLYSSAEQHFLTSKHLILEYHEFSYAHSG